MAVMDPGLRRDDVVETSSARNVIPAQAGIQQLNVIPAQAGIQQLNVIPAQAGIQQLLDFNFWSLCDALRVAAESLWDLPEADDRSRYDLLHATRYLWL